MSKKFQMDSGTVMHLDLDELYIDMELNNRDSMHTSEEIENLASSIKATNGLLQPVGVIKTPEHRKAEHDKPYELIFGFGRVQALKHLAEMEEQDTWIKSVYVNCIGGDEKHGKLAQIIENIQRKQLNAAESSSTICELLEENTELTQAALSKILGLSESNISQLVKIDKLPEETKELIRSGELSFSHARELSNVGLTDPEQINLQAKSGATMTYGEFCKKLNATYKKGDGAGVDSTGNKESQKSSPGLRQNVVREKYLPHLTELWNNSKKPNEKAVLQLRIDTVKWMLGEDSSLGQELKPWEEEIQAKAKSESEGKESAQSKKRFLSILVRTIKAELNAVPSILLPDGTPNPNRSAKTIPEVLASIGATVDEHIAEGAADGKNNSIKFMETTTREGVSTSEVSYIEIESSEKFMEQVRSYYMEVMKEDDKKKKIAEENKAKKELEYAKAVSGTTLPLVTA